MGERDYSSPPKWTLRVSPDVISLAPLQRPPLSLEILIGICQLGGGIVGSLLIPGPSLWPLWMMVVVWIVSFIGVRLWYFDNFNRGAWLVFRRQDKRVLLPRSKKTYEFDQVICLQLLEGIYYASGSLGVAELNLLVNRDAQTERHPLIGSIVLEEVEKVAKQLADMTGIKLLVTYDVSNRPIREKKPASSDR